MPAVRPYSADLNNNAARVPLALGDALMLKAQNATSQGRVALAEANGVSYAGAATSGTTTLQVGPFAAAVVLQLSAAGSVRAETSVAGMSVTV